ncbi:MAG: hypothetical protein ABIK96_12755 [bacterium]
MKGGREKNDAGTRPRPRKTTAVTEPHLTVVEGAEPADPTALDEVLELLVTWAVRAHQGRCSTADGSVTCDIDRACEGSN